MKTIVQLLKEDRQETSSYAPIQPLFVVLSFVIGLLAYFLPKKFRWTVDLFTALLFLNALVFITVINICMYTENQELQCYRSLVVLILAFF